MSFIEFDFKNTDLKKADVKSCQLRKCNLFNSRLDDVQLHGRNNYIRYDGTTFRSHVMVLGACRFFTLGSQRHSHKIFGQIGPSYAKKNFINCIREIRMMDKSLRVCVDKIIGQPPPQYIMREEVHSNLRSFDEPLRAAMLFQKKWPDGRPLTIRFLEGEGNVQEKVKEKALDWTKYANIKFDFVNTKEDADIQISFKKGDGSWSYIGTDANTIDPGEPTMNFAWLDVNTPDKEYSRVVKHEFGHALGLIHEHQNPADGIKWDKNAVCQALSSPPNSWDPETIEHNMFERYGKSITNYTEVDPGSIMMYYIPPEWTLDHKSYGENVFELSDSDKEFIKKQYH